MNNNVRVLRFKFRWRVVPVDDQTVEVHIPTGGSTPMLNPAFVSLFRLSDDEIEAIHDVALREIAIDKSPGPDTPKPTSKL